MASEQIKVSWYRTENGIEATARFPESTPGWQRDFPLIGNRSVKQMKEMVAVMAESRGLAHVPVELVERARPPCPTCGRPYA